MTYLSGKFFVIPLFLLDLLDDLFQRIVGLRAYHKIPFGKNERGHTIQPVFACQLDIC